MDCDVGSINAAAANMSRLEEELLGVTSPVCSSTCSVWSKIFCGPILPFVLKTHGPGHFTNEEDIGVPVCQCRYRFF